MKLRRERTPRRFLNPAAVSDLYDFNRDGFVNATDQILARSHSTTLATSLSLISPPASLDVSASLGAVVPALNEIALALAIRTDPRPAGATPTLATESSQSPLAVALSADVPAATNRAIGLRRIAVGRLWPGPRRRPRVGLVRLRDVRRARRRLLVGKRNPRCQGDLPIRSLTS